MGQGQGQGQGHKTRIQGHTNINRGPRLGLVAGGIGAAIVALAVAGTGSGGVGAEPGITGGATGVRLSLSLGVTNDRNESQSQELIHGHRTQASGGGRGAGTEAGTSSCGEEAVQVSGVREAAVGDVEGSAIADDGGGLVHFVVEIRSGTTDVFSIAFFARTQLVGLSEDFYCDRFFLRHKSWGKKKSGDFRDLPLSRKPPL